MKRVDMTLEVVVNTSQVFRGEAAPQTETVFLVKDKVVFYREEKAGEIMLTCINLTGQAPNFFYTTESLSDFRKRFLNDQQAV